MIAAILLFIAFDLLGNWIQRRLAVAIPGPLIGLILLTVVFCIRPQWAGKSLRSGARLLLLGMSLFFVPAGTGVITEWSEIRGQWFPIAMALCLSTAACLFASNWTMLVLDRLFAGRALAATAAEGTD